LKARLSKQIEQLLGRRDRLGGGPVGRIPICVVENGSAEAIPLETEEPGEWDNLVAKKGFTHDQVMGEAQVQWSDRIEELEVLVGKSNVQRLDVLQEVLDLAPANDGEHEGCFMEDIRNGDCETDRK
jgi:hypothetical protein